MTLTGYAPAAASVECGRSAHTLVWRDGILHAEDHADPNGERALAALGGPSCRCIELLDVWSAHAADPRVLTIGPRGDVLTAGDRGSGWASSSSTVMWRSLGGSSRPAQDPSIGLETLLGLGGTFARRLVASAAESLISAGSWDAETRRILHAALYGRVLVALTHFLGRLPELELELIPADAPAELVADHGDRAQARLPLRWLLDVWGPGLEIVGDRFTLAATHSPVDGWTLSGVDSLMVRSAWRLGPT